MNRYLKRINNEFPAIPSEHLFLGRFEEGTLLRCKTWIAGGDGLKCSDEIEMLLKDNTGHWFVGEKHMKWGTDDEAPIEGEVSGFLHHWEIQE